MMNLCCKQILCENPCANSSLYCKVTNQGSLLVAFYIDYSIGATFHRKTSSLIKTNNSGVIKLPTFATNIAIRILNKSVANSPVIYSKNMSSPSKVCFLVQGSPENPICDQVLCNPRNNITNPCLCTNVFINCN
ncbi:hypothetical protein G8S49_07885 [Clostridium botulinum C]|uniref:Uncharacterized protein n=2 Tax=Clostridium botulinum TaxID=1491 RepID=A0A9Q4TIY8_CLOBO|nr:hypothetical protein [Clostridium botulinum]EGO89301.1 hypothetical protein CBCST_00355 [Clostridium botulinum C str. Stockholm]MCD3195289.1 hypothetical protein [Clostridium botulinum C]MCD3200627.1 hypothetical protein [Clostridium botulinum C]MCD3206035.1 hypothetical protein [Clostridium botulinum C]MCD3208488.1 hypothetical protein [Clostridium botulinum C]